MCLQDIFSLLNEILFRFVWHCFVHSVGSDSRSALTCWTSSLCCLRDIDDDDDDTCIKVSKL